MATEIIGHKHRADKIEKTCIKDQKKSETIFAMYKR